MQINFHPLHLYFNLHQGCALAEPSGPWSPTFASGRLENLIFFIQITYWAPQILQVQSTGHPSIFLRAQTCAYFCVLSTPRISETISLYIFWLFYKLQYKLIPSPISCQKTPICYRSIIFAPNITTLLHEFIKSLQNTLLDKFPFPSLKNVYHYHGSLFLHTGIHIHFLSESSAGQASLMAYSTCPVTVWVAGTEVQNYKQIGDKNNCMQLEHFMSCILFPLQLPRKGFY